MSLGSGRTASTAACTSSRLLSSGPFWGNSQRGPISPGRLPPQLGGQGPFNMDMELHLRDFEDELVVGGQQILSQLLEA